MESAKYIAGRFLLHLGGSTSLVLAVFFFTDWVHRRWEQGMPLILAGALVFAGSTLREAWDVARGQSLRKAVVDYASWLVGTAASVWALARFRGLLALCLLPFCLPASAQVQDNPAATGGRQIAVIAFTPQPLESFKAAFGSKLPGVAVYDVVVCNNSPQYLDVPAGRVYQAALAGMAPLNRSLTQATLRRARRGSRWHQVAAVAEWLGFAAGLLTASGTIAASEAVRVIPPIVAAGAHRLRDQYDSEQPEAAKLFEKDFLEDVLVLPPGGCASRILLGRYDKAVKPFVVDMEIRRGDAAPP